jgi:hypothetical protein
MGLHPICILCGLVFPLPPQGGLLIDQHPGQDGDAAAQRDRPEERPQDDQDRPALAGLDAGGGARNVTVGHLRRFVAGREDLQAPAGRVLHREILSPAVVEDQLEHLQVPPLHPLVDGFIVGHPPDWELGRGHRPDHAVDLAHPGIVVRLEDDTVAGDPQRAVDRVIAQVGWRAAQVTGLPGRDDLLSRL